MNSIAKLIACILVVAGFVGCNNLNHYDGVAVHPLKFSTDTLTFDTVFTTVGSATKQLMVYNPNNENVKFDVTLAGAGQSGFRINVDGRKGDHFQQLEIWKKDSLYVAVEVTVNPNDHTLPVLIQDSILFYVDGKVYSVLLTAHGQNVHIIKGGVSFTNDTTLNNELPYLIYDSLKVEENITLTIEQGTTLYFHNNAKLIVNGTLVVDGTQQQPVVMRGDRLDAIYADVILPYDLTAGQWHGVKFGGNSFDNQLNYTIIRNAVSGIHCETSTTEHAKLNIHNSQITNMEGHLLEAVNCDITATGTEFTNATGNVLALTGGKYHFVHCTFANFKILGSRNPQATCVKLANFQEDGETINEYPLQQATFENCIVDGSFDRDSTVPLKGEIELVTQLPDDQAGNNENFNYHFRYSFVKTAQNNGDRFEQVLFNNYPTYRAKGTKDENYMFDFRLDNESNGIGNADTNVAASYPIDRYGVSRINNETAPTIGAYEFVYQEKDESDK